jgi:hypothetical protein
LPPGLRCGRKRENRRTHPQSKEYLLHLHAILPERYRAYKSLFPASLGKGKGEGCCTKGQIGDNAPSVLVLSQGETLTSLPMQLLMPLRVYTHQEAAKRHTTDGSLVRIQIRAVVQGNEL